MSGRRFFSPVGARALLVAALGLGLLGGCAPRRIEAGTVIDAAEVTAIHPGQSTRADVTRLLGPPAGQGSLMLPFQDHPYPTWTYLFTRRAPAADGQLHVRHGNLLVYFAGETVAGYFWLDVAGQ